MRVQLALLALFLSSSVVAASGPARKRSARNQPHPQPKVSSPPSAPATGVPLAVSEPVARVVQYGDRDIVRVKTKVRYTSLLVLPQAERILDFACGDKEFWIVEGAHNFAYIKPAKIGAQTNLNLTTASGNIYSFILNEVSEKPDEPDLKVFIELKQASMIAAANGPPRFFSAHDVEHYRQQAETAKEETRRVTQEQDAAVQRGVSKLLSKVHCGYRFEANKRPFLVKAICHDDKFTYIEASPEEAAALYEIQDGKPNLVNFTYRDGMYVVEKIVDRGYLTIGKQKMNFSRGE